MKKIFTLLFFALLEIHLVAQTCNALDPTFGTGGIRVGITSGNGLDARNIIVQPDNKIIQIGTVYYSSGARFSIIRYNSDGTLDNTFGQGGIVISSISHMENAFYGALQSDGKILIAGTINGGGLVLARYNQNGTVDNSFGGTGSVVATNLPPGNFATGLAIQPDGRIVAAGSTTRADDCLVNTWGSSYCPNHFTIFRYKSNGTLDSSFGQNGMVVTSVGPEHVGSASNVVIQADGKIIAAGFYLYGLTYDDYYGSYYYSSSHFAMVRYQADGTVDSSFGTYGIAAASDLQNTSAMSLQADGKIVVTGSGSRPFGIARFNVDGTPDTNFGTGGQQSNSFDSWANSILLLPSGKIVVAGGSINNLLLARLNTDGSFDTSFNGSGRLQIHLGPTGSYDYAVGIGLQGSHLVIGGRSYYYSGNGGNNDSQLIIRLLDSVHALPLVITPRSTLYPCLYNSTRLAINETGSIQWFKDGSPLVGATDTVYIASESGNYSAKVENAKGCGESDPVRVSINGMPIVITPSGSLNFCQGDSVILTISETGNVQWYKNNIIIPGMTSSSYTAKEAGYYFAAVQNAKGCGQSSVLYVTINPVRPSVAWDGTKLYTSSSNYSYQWYLNGDSIPGAKSYYFTPTQLGVYKVDVADYKCNRTSDDFHFDCSVISVLKPIIGYNGAQLTASPGFANYQWYFNGDSIFNAHSNALTPTQLGTYKVIVTGNFGCQNFAEFQASCTSIGRGKPSIDWDGTKFSTAIGYPNYQWYQNDTAITGATTNTFTPGDTQFGFFKVGVTDNIGCSNTSDSYPHFVTAVTDITVGDARIHFYPNPAQSVLNVDIGRVGAGKLEAHLYDLSGRLVQKKLLNQLHNQFHVEAISSGLYQLVIYNGTEKFATKIAVIK